MRFVMSIVVLAALAFSTTTASAQDGDPERARALFLEGVEAFDREAPAEALRLFQESYGLRRSQLVLFNIAVTERRLRRDEDALTHLYEWVWLDEGEDEGRLAEIQSVMDELAPRLATLRLIREPSSATVRVDGAVPNNMTEDGIIVLRPGVYSLTFEAEGHEPSEHDVTLEAGSDETVRVSLEASAVESTDPEAAVVTEQGEGGGLLFTWIGAGLTVAFAGLAVGAWVAGESEFANLQDTCAPGCSDEQVSTLETWDLLTNVGIIGAGVMAAATVILALVELGVFSGSNEEPPAHSVSVGPTGASYRYRF